MGKESIFPYHPGPNFEFNCMIRKCANGFLLTINGMEFVVQGDGNKREDFEKMMDAIRAAHEELLRRV